MRHRIVLLAALVLSFPSPERAHADPPPPRSNRDSPTRIRLALELGAGPVFGETRGAGLGLVGALGVQISDTVGLFWQPMLGVYGFASNDDTEVFVFGSQLAVLDFTIGRALQLGVGAGVDHGQFALCSSVTDTCTNTERQVQLGTEARASVIIPLPGVRARWGIPFTAHFHVTWFDDSQIMAVIVTAGLVRY